MSRAVKTTRYFISTEPLSRLGSQERDALVATTCLAFNEDKVVIEAQQRLLDLTPNPMMMATLHDKAVTMFNRMAKTMMDEEAAGTTQKVA